jgi:Do/DeqQ family serine protease
MKNARNFNLGTVIFLVAAIIAVGSGFFLGRVTAPSSPPAGAAAEQAASVLARNDVALLPENATSFRDIVSRVMPSIVQIDVVDVVQQSVPSNPFNFFFGPGGRPGERPRGNSPESTPREFRRQGLGSGVVVRRAGRTLYVLTNNHVVSRADEIQVRLFDGREFDAKIVGMDPQRDLALVSFQTTDKVQVAELGDSASLMPGDWVLAMGSPLGFQSTVTAGIVSAVGRDSMPGRGIAGLTDYIQTDAAINQGNSGGALVNLDGQVVGVNSWIASPSGGSVGLGFAIPVNNATRVIDDFIVKGRVDYGWLGITVGDVGREGAENLGVRPGAGALVHGVFRGSPADEGGLQPGDFVTAIDGNTIGDSGDLVRVVGGLAPGTRARFDLIRNGERATVSVRLQSRGTDEELAGLSQKLWPGFTVDDSEGAVVVSAVDQGAPAARVLQPGDEITRISGDRVSGLGDFYRLLEAKKTESRNGDVLFTIKREGSELIIGLMS